MTSWPAVVVAPDAFKGTMSATVVASALADGVVARGGSAVCRPLADGGEGTTDVMEAALGGRRVEVNVHGTLGELVRTSFLLTRQGRTAVVDTAAASGLEVVPPDRRDAEAASSYGTGEMLVAAADAGAQEILLGVGGSGCTDGGAGAIEAIERGGGLGGARVTVLCDVQTPFEEAALVFGPQKGADAAAVQRLSERLQRLAALLPRDPRGVPRTGAAGGLSGGLWAAYGARLVSGIDTVLNFVGFDEVLSRADAVITGEGRLDRQTAEGKVIAGVIRRATHAGVPVWAVVGQCALTSTDVTALGLMSVREATEPAGLRSAASDLVRDFAALSRLAHSARPGDAWSASNSFNNS